MADDAIEASIMRYVLATVQRNDFPTRYEAIRNVTGSMPVMPSLVGKALTRMVEAGTFVERADGRLSMPAKK